MSTHPSARRCSTPQGTGAGVVLLPYTAEKLNPQTVALLEAYVPPDVEWVWREIDPSDSTAYSRILIEAWSWPGSLMIVEQDIGIRAGVVEELLGCSQPWCGFPYAIGEALLVCLGCTKFSAHLKAMQPNLMAEAAAITSEMDGGGVPAGDWRRMDVRIAACLERLGHNRHAHGPAVTHFHQY